MVMGLWCFNFFGATYCRPLHAQNGSRIRQVVTSLEIVVDGDDGLIQGLVEAIRAEVAENRDLAITGDVAETGTEEVKFRSGRFLAPRSSGAYGPTKNLPPWARWATST